MDISTIIHKYHPIVNLVFRPIYKSLGGRYRPLLAESVVGGVSYAFHTAFLSTLSGGLIDYFQEGDLKQVSVAALISLIFPVGHGVLAIAKHRSLREEKEKYKKELSKDEQHQDIDLLVEQEFRRRRKEYKTTPKIYI